MAIEEEESGADERGRLNTGQQRQTPEVVARFQPPLPPPSSRLAAYLAATGLPVTIQDDFAAAALWSRGGATATSTRRSIATPSTRRLPVTTLDSPVGSAASHSPRAATRRSRRRSRACGWTTQRDDSHFIDAALGTTPAPRPLDAARSAPTGELACRAPTMWWRRHCRTVSAWRTTRMDWPRTASRPIHVIQGIDETGQVKTTSRAKPGADHRERIH